MEENKKMKRFKNSAVLMLGLCLAASMCACSKSDSTEEETTEQETQATTTEATTAEEKAEEETEEPEEEDDSSAPDIERVEGTGETLLGFNDWYLEKESQGDVFNIWTFYTSEGEPFAVQFGFDNSSEPVYYVDDFDGDGSDDIICNNQFGGDGAMRVYVFRNNGNTIEVGQEAVSGELCVMGYNVVYDSEKKKVLFSNYADDTDEVLTSDDFEFVPYDEADLD